MESFMKEFEHLKIQLEDIKSTTNNFETNVIGCGGFGKVYGGELSHFKGRGMVAIKRLDSKSMQGNTEFWKEIMMLSRYSHPNLISLLGFCDEGSEKILVYEHASRGSLDRHLRSTDLSWMQRIKICLDAAKGLSYLHDDKGTQQRVLHRDIKSSNILIDENWNAKVSDMGLSKIGAANQQHTAHVTNPAGTFGYCDPLYIETGLLTKESDVYSFGVLLFEVLCGKLCFENRNGILVPKWKESYEQNKLQEIIFHDMKQQMDPNSLEVYSEIAFKCLQKSRAERPTMPQVVEKLELALKYQEIFELVQLPKNYKEMLTTAAAPLNYGSESELKMLLLKGILLNGDKTWFSLNMNGQNCEMISIAECLSEPPHYIPSRSPECNSRFAAGCYEPLGQKFKTRVTTQFLSPSITYTVNLMFKNKKSRERYIGLEYKLDGEKRKSYSFLSDEREDGWLTAELYQFTSDQKTADLEILFYTKWCPTLLVEGIEFRPMEKVEHEVLRNIENDDMQSISDTETFWEQKVPIDYGNIIKLSKDGVLWRTKKELYYILREGLLIKDGEEWFSLDKEGKKCLMLPAIAVLEENKWEWKSLPETRFEEVADGNSDKFDIYCKFRSKMLSPQTTYATYLVYKLPDDYKDLPAPVQVVDENSDLKEAYNIFLSTPQTPVINRNIMIKKTYNPSVRPIIKGRPKLRTDGWMEVHVWEFQTLTTIKMISARLQFSSYDKVLSKGITVQGLEFRPI